MSEKQRRDLFPDKGDKFVDQGEKIADIIAVSHEVVSPRDAASGQATGRRQHEPEWAHGTDDDSLDKHIIKLAQADDSSAGDGEGIKAFDFDKLVDHEGFKEVMPKVVDSDYEEIAFEKLVDAGREHPGLVTELGFPALAIEDDGAPLEGITAMDDWETPASLQDSDHEIEYDLIKGDAEDKLDPLRADHEGEIDCIIEIDEPAPVDFGQEQGDGYAIEIGGQMAGLIEADELADGLDG